MSKKPFHKHEDSDVEVIPIAHIREWKIKPVQPVRKDAV